MGSIFLTKLARIVLLGMAAGVVDLGSAAAQHAPKVAAVPGVPGLPLGTFDLGKLGYTVREYFVSGQATSYTEAGDNGAIPAATAPYRTRVVVIRPTDPARFNGTTVVEWLNVSGGLDGPPDWIMTHRELMRSGYAYVGVSAQKVGIDGGPSLGPDMSLKKVDPGRYGALHHPSDAFSFDIFSQAGRLVRSGDGDLLQGLKPARVLAVGESQSAHFLTSYINRIDPIARVYDGFLVHSRFAGAASLDGASMVAMHPDAPVHPVRFRDDLRVPVITVITETDLLGLARPGYVLARQPDNERLRVWEIPGTAHGDIYLAQVGAIDDGTLSPDVLARAFAPTSHLLGMTLARPINFAPQHHYVVEAALAALDTWVQTGRPPSTEPRIALADPVPPASVPTIVLDQLGVATGGVRTPWVDVPVARTSGGGNSGAPMAAMFGSGETLDPATLRTLYPGGKAAYLNRFEASLDDAIARGVLLPADRQEIFDLAARSFPAE